MRFWKRKRLDETVRVPARVPEGRNWAVGVLEFELPSTLVEAQIAVRSNLAAIEAALERYLVLTGQIRVEEEEGE